MAGKLPYIQFFPGDWLRDNVSGCSLNAQGLWLRMLILAHDSDRYGYLSINGTPMPPEHIASRCGTPLGQYVTLLAELDAAGVPSRTVENIIYSRRMVRDAGEREANAKRQAKFRRKRNASSNGGSNAGVTPINEDEHEVEPEGSKKKRRARFVAPTLDEVSEYCTSRSDSIDPQTFMAHYESNGWMVGKNRMKDWRAAVRYWEKNQDQFSSKGNAKPRQFSGLEAFAKKHGVNGGGDEQS